MGPGSRQRVTLTDVSGFDHGDKWGHRAGEPNKAVICSLALARLRTDIKGDVAGGNAVGMAQKLLLFWRKPARRCWWEGVELQDVEGVPGKLKVWIRRVWTLEMVSSPPFCRNSPLLTWRAERNRVEMTDSRIPSVLLHIQNHLRCKSCSLIHRVSIGVQAKSYLCRSRLRHHNLKAQVIFLLASERGALTKQIFRDSFSVCDIAVAKLFSILLELVQTAMTFTGTPKPPWAATK